MSKNELEDWLDELDITAIEAAEYLGVGLRSIHRWLQYPEQMRESAKLPFRAWLQLKAHNLPWKPDAIDVLDFYTKEQECDLLSNYTEEPLNKYDADLP